MKYPPMGRAELVRLWPTLTASERRQMRDRARQALAAIAAGDEQKETPAGSAGGGVLVKPGCASAEPGLRQPVHVLTSLSRKPDAPDQ